KAASRILAIDGCPMDCAKKTLEQIGCTGFGHVRVTDLGMEKGKSPATDAGVETVVKAAHPLLG
ncbi:MAG: putative zinc-binding protein, partial [Phycisphaerales bacterium]